VYECNASRWQPSGRWGMRVTMVWSGTLCSRVKPHISVDPLLSTITAGRGLPALLQPEKIRASLPCSVILSSLDNSAEVGVLLLWSTAGSCSRHGLTRKRAALHVSADI